MGRDGWQLGRGEPKGWTPGRWRCPVQRRETKKSFIQRAPQDEVKSFEKLVDAAPTEVQHLFEDYGKWRRGFGASEARW